jgi:hypothetical protein
MYVHTSSLAYMMRWRRCGAGVASVWRDIDFFMLI